MIKNKKGMIVPLILGLIVIALIAVIFISGISVRTAEKAFTMANESLEEESAFVSLMSQDYFGKTLYLKSQDSDTLAQAMTECIQKCESYEWEGNSAFFCNYLDSKGDISYDPVLKKVHELDPKIRFRLFSLNIGGLSEGVSSLCCAHVPSTRTRVIITSDEQDCLYSLYKYYHKESGGLHDFAPVDISKLNN